jgi:flagellar motor protein MotB
MEAAQTINPPTFESVWATLQEVAAMQKETDRIMRENAAKFDLQMKETDKQMKETDKKIGKLSNRFGEVVEYMVAPKLCEKFGEMGLHFLKSNSGTIISDYVNKIFLEIDVMLENLDKAMLVEAKVKPTTEDVKEHIERLEKMRKYADLHGDTRAFLGTLAGVVVTPNVKEYALGQGFYVIEPSGETFSITPPNGQPKEW